jgi:hypothetical protein
MNPCITELLAGIAHELDIRRGNFPDRVAAQREAVEGIRWLEDKIATLLRGKLLRKRALPLLSSGGKTELRGARMRGRPFAKVPCFPTVLEDPRELLYDGRGPLASPDYWHAVRCRLIPDFHEVREQDRSLVLYVREKNREGVIAPRPLGRISALAVDRLESELSETWSGPIVGPRGTVSWAQVRASYVRSVREYDIHVEPATDDRLLIEDLLGYVRALDYLWEQLEYLGEITQEQRAFAARVHELLPRDEPRE